jgi:outer membrane cobalamin receptor
MLRIGKLLKYALLCILVCFNYMISSAQGIQDSLFLIPEVEVSGQRIFQKEKAGMKETKVDSVILMQKINANLSTLLAENTPIYIKDYGRGALATTSFRGTAPSHTQVSWNGININSPMLGMVDFSLIPVYIIDDLSLKHGAASTSEQSGGLGGHINLENKVNWLDTLSGRYIQSVGSFATFEEFGQLNIGNKTLQSKTRAYHSYSKNNFPFTNRSILPHEDQRNENADFGKYGLMQELYYRPMSHMIISAKTWGQKAFRAIPVVNSDQSGDETKEKINEQNDDTFKAIIDLEYYMDKLSLKAFTGFDYQKLNYLYGFTTSAIETIFINSNSEMSSWYNMVATDYKLSTNISFKANAKFNRFDISSSDKILQTGYDVIRHEGSLFLGAYYELNRIVQFNGNVRKDYVENRSTPLIYTIGTSIKPFKKQNLIIKANAVRNFRNPALNDLYWQPSGNPNLKPEKGYTYESGLVYGYGTKIWSINTEITGYYSEINNWITWFPSTSGPWSPLNLKKVESKGIEISFQGSLKVNKTQFYANGNYAYTSTVNKGEALTEQDISIGKQLPLIPKHSGNLFLKAENRGFYIGFQHNSYSRRYAVYTNDDSESIIPYYLNHASVGKHSRLKRFHFDASLKVNNLFDENYKSVLKQYMPRRNFMVMLKVGF